MLPVRLDPALRAMVIATDPLPEPDEPETTSAQLTPLPAVHAHPCAAVTVRDGCPPFASIEIALGETSYVQLGGVGFGVGVGTGVGVGGGGVGSGDGVG